MSAGGPLSPAATEIEAQTIRWIAELIGYPTGCGGLLVSGGNMANFVCFLAARAARAGWDVRREGLGASQPTARRIRIRRNAHLDSEGDRSRRSRHRVDSLDSYRRRSPHGRDAARTAYRLRRRRRSRALYRHRDRGIGQHRSRGPAAADRARVPRPGNLVPCRRRLRRLCGRGAGRA